MDWHAFRPLFNVIHQKQRKSNAGRKPHDVTLMFKMLVLQALYNLSDDATEFQVRDRLPFQRFPGLSPDDTVPDAKTLGCSASSWRATGGNAATRAEFTARAAAGAA